MKKMVTEKKNHKLGIQVLGYFVLLFAMSMIVNALFGVGPNWIMKRIGVSQNVRVFIGSTFSYCGRLITIILLSAWSLKRVLKIDPWDAMFGRSNKKWWKELLFGILLSVGIMTLIFIIENQIGWLEIKGWQWQYVPRIEYLRIVWLAVLVNVTVAVSEEVIFRGYFLTGLEKAWGKPISLGVMTVIFSAIHLGVLESNETNTLLFVILLTIPGLVFGLIYYQARTLWVPIGIHFAWNFMQDEILNLHGRGSANLIGAITKQTGPSWIVGTNYGIEVGLVGIVAMVIVGICSLLWIRKTQSQ